MQPFFFGNFYRRLPKTFAVFLLTAVLASCSTPGANEPYFGRTVPPARDVVRYVSGPEPETLDPQLGSGQVEQRIYVGLFEGLVEYEPKTLEPVPAIAERWEANADSSEFTFYLRKNAKWSNGEAITARDFVYSVQRGLEPKTASRNAGQAYYIRYAQAFNETAAFVQDARSGEFLNEETTQNRLTVPIDEKAQAAAFKANPKLQTIIAGKTLVPVTAADVGVAAVDDFTVKISLAQPVAFFVKTLTHNFFRFVPERAITDFKKQWTKPEHIVTSGAFRLKRWSPYYELTLEKNPHYWDAANVRLEEISFYPVEEQPTVMNLYKAGDVDATYNRSVPRSWLSFVRQKQDHADEREASISYYVINTTKPPMDDVRVRRAFSLALDRNIIVATKPGVKPVTSLLPPGIFADFPSQPIVEFNPELAKQLLAEAGYADDAGNYDAAKFPLDEIAVTFNTAESNRLEAEIIQSQWKRNLGLQVPLRNMETRKFLEHATKLEYKGFARFGYAADYIDPYSLLNLFETAGGNNATGWTNPRYAELLAKANQTLDQTERYKLLAQAEDLFIKDQPIMPLTTSTTNFMKKPFVKGLYANALTLHPWKFVYIERDRSKW